MVLEHPFICKFRSRVFRRCTHYTYSRIIIHYSNNIIYIYNNNILYIQRLTYITGCRVSQCYYVYTIKVCWYLRIQNSYQYNTATALEMKFIKEKHYGKGEIY